MSKIFVLDTNVILHNPYSILAFEDNTVVLPIEVLEELDNFKRSHDEKGRNARIAIRMLDRLRTKGAPGEGFPLENGGVLKIAIGSTIDSAAKLGMKVNITDNRILFSAYMFKELGEKVIFVSKDINARIKADAIGLTSMDFEKEKVDFDNLYKGWQSLEMERKDIDSFYENKEYKIDSGKFYPNEFALMVDSENLKHTAIGRYNDETKTVIPMVFNRTPVMSIKPRNKEQAMAMELLMNVDVSLVTLVGAAGTGKTLLAIAAGLHKVLKDKTYNGLLVSRPVMPLGRDIGYLPGTKEEKLENWMGPIYDNIECILNAEKKGKEAPVKIKSKTVIDKYIREEIIELEAMTFMRGRSIPDRFIIIDEAQNLTPHEVKTVLSRSGNHTKVVLTGDPYQIDNPYLDSASNGLAYCVDKMKGQKTFGHITLTKSERSPLASLAAELL